MSKPDLSLEAFTKWVKEQPEGARWDFGSQTCCAVARFVAAATGAKDVDVGFVTADVDGRLCHLDRSLVLAAHAAATDDAVITRSALLRELSKRLPRALEKQES